MAVALYAVYRITPRQYDALIASLELDAEPPIGGILHFATQTPAGVDVFEIWQTREAAEAFYEQRLAPAARSVGVRLEPEVRVTALHNLFVPDLATVERIGATSVPAVGWGVR